jgi:hypothetical protein
MRRLTVGPILLLALLLSVPCFAQEAAGADTTPAVPATSTAASLTYGGSADFYFSTNFNDPFTGENALRAWDHRDEHGPHLGLIDLWVQQARDPVGFRFDVNFGPTARRFNAFEPSSSDLWEHIQQAYVGVNLHREGKTYVELGKWLNPTCVEAPEPKDNWLYSRGLLYTLAMPFYFTGGRVYHYFNSMDYVMVHVNRGWNAVGNPHHAPGFGISGMKRVGGRWMLMGSYFGGEEAEMGMMPGMMGGGMGMGMGGGMGMGEPRTSYRHLFDIAATQMPGGPLSFTHNATIGIQGDAKWYGLSSQARYDFNRNEYLALRGEVLRDQGGMMTGGDQTLGSLTLGYTRRVSPHAQVRLEYRHDFAGGGKPFAGDRPGSFRSGQDTFTIATIVNY